MVDADSVVTVVDAADSVSLCAGACVVSVVEKFSDDIDEQRARIGESAGAHLWPGLLLA